MDPVGTATGDGRCTDITRDNVPARVDAVAHFRAVDADASVADIEDGCSASSTSGPSLVRGHDQHRQFGGVHQARGDGAEHRRLNRTAAARADEDGGGGRLAGGGEQRPPVTLP
jgi:hypothetical protein